jgi:radical SAM superfamily enzyme YgiQ (UPF0313 family)
VKIVLLLSAGKLIRDVVSNGKLYRYYAPTTLLQLQALIPKELNAEVKLIDLGVDKFSEDFDMDLLAISAITCAAPEAYRIANIARKRGVKVVIGGYHVSFLVEEALQFADSVVVGFAENTWPELLRDFAHNRLKRVYKDNSPNLHFDPPPLNRALLDKRKYFTTNTIEATRGCPHKCGFCVINPFNGQQHMQRPIKSVVEEIEKMGKRVLFFDASPIDFCVYIKKLLKEIIPLKVHWYSASTLRLAQDNELLELMVKSGCKGVQIGFESINQDSLNSIGKQINKVELYKPFIEKLHDNGISILGAFILGFDNDDSSVFNKTIDFIINSKIDLIKLGILTPLPGSDLFNNLKKQNRILTENWELYDTDHCVFKPARLTEKELEEGYNKVFDHVYAFSSIFKRIIRKKASYAIAIPANIILRRLRKMDRA